jgi:sugar phosphate isomerase/epimerase
MNRLSLAHLTIDNADPFELIDAAARSGFDSVGLRVVSAPGAPPRPRVAGDPALLARLAEAIVASGVTVLQVNSFWLTPETTPDDIQSVVEAGARLAASNVLVVINDPEPARGAAHLAACCAAAAPLGIGIALEFHRYSQVRTLAQAVATVEQSGFANAGIVLDVLHFDRSGGHPRDLSAAPAERLAFVQLCDAPAQHPPADALRIEARSRRLYPGEGELPLFAVMDALPPAIPLDVEAPCERTAHLSAFEQAQLAATATRRFLAAYAQHRAG